MADQDRFQGEVTATLRSIDKTQTLMREEFTSFREKDTKSHEKMFSKMSDMEKEMSGIGFELSGHISDDSRQFGRIWKTFFGIGAIFGAIATAVQVFAG